MSILPSSLAKTTSVVTVRESNVLPKKSFIFDFEKKDFCTDSMKNVVTTSDKEEIVRGVVEKILNDTRYRYPIYDRTWGNEIPDLLAQDDSFEVMESELQRLVREALVWHPYISDVTDITVTQEGARLYVNFVVSAVNGILFDVKKEVTG